MLKVLIADDERKVCQLIEKLIDWKSQEMQVIATAENGMEALEVIQKSQPDIPAYHTQNRFFLHR